MARSQSQVLNQNTSQDDQSQLRKKIGMYINEYDADFYCFSNFFTVISIVAGEFILYANSGDAALEDKSAQTDLEAECKVIGGSAALPISLIFSIACFIWVKKFYSKKSLNDWFRRFATGSKVGNYAGSFLGDLAGLFLPRALATPLKTFFSAGFSMLAGVAGVIFGSDGPDISKKIDRNNTEELSDVVTRDGWSRYAKIGMLLGFVFGGAICALALILFPAAIPVALSVPVWIGMWGAAGAVIGFVSSFGIVKWWNGSHGDWFSKIVKWWNHDSHEHVEYTVVDKRNETQSLHLKEEERYQIQIVRSALKVEEMLDEKGQLVFDDEGNPVKVRCQILWYRTVAPNGKTKTAIIKLGNPNYHDIEHNPDKPFDLADKNNQDKIIEFASKNGHIYPINLADNRHRTKYVRTALQYGLALGTLIGFAVSVLYAPFVVLAVVVVLSAIAWKGGPILSRWINPHDQFYNSYDYGTATLLTVLKSVGNAVKNDIASLVLQLAGGTVGGLYDIAQGVRQRKKLEEKLVENKEQLTGKTDAEVEYEAAKEFERNRPLVAWSQRLMPFATYGGLLFGAIGFLIAGPFGSLIGVGIGAIVCGGIGLVWGQVFYKWLMEKISDQPVVETRNKFSWDPAGGTEDLKNQHEQEKELITIKQEIEPAHTEVTEAHKNQIKKPKHAKKTKQPHPLSPRQNKNEDHTVEDIPPLASVPLSADLKEPVGERLTSNLRNITRNSKKYTSYLPINREENAENGLMTANTGRNHNNKKLSLPVKSNLVLLAEYIVNGEVEKAQQIYKKDFSLLIKPIDSGVVDAVGCQFVNLSPCQLAYCVGNLTLLNDMWKGLKETAMKAEALLAVSQINKFEENKELYLQSKQREKAGYSFKCLAEKITKKFHEIDNDSRYLAFKELFSPQKIHYYDRIDMPNVLAYACQVYMKNYHQWSDDQLSFYVNNVISPLNRLAPNRQLMEAFQQSIPKGKSDEREIILKCKEVWFKMERAYQENYYGCFKFQQELSWDLEIDNAYAELRDWKKKKYKDWSGMTNGKISDLSKKDHEAEAVDQVQKSQPIRIDSASIKTQKSHDYSPISNPGLIPHYASFASHQNINNDVFNDSDTIVIKDGLSGEEKLVTLLAEHILNRRYNDVEVLLKENPLLVFKNLKDRVRDFVGFEYTNMSPLQLAYASGDACLCNIILPYIQSQPQGKKKAIKQIDEIELARQSCQTYNFNQLAVIIDKCAGDDFFNPTMSSFKNYFQPKRIISPNYPYHFNVIKNLIAALKADAGWEGLWEMPQAPLFWRKHVINYLISLLPANFANIRQDQLLNFLEKNQDNLVEFKNKVMKPVVTNTGFKQSEKKQLNYGRFFVGVQKTQGSILRGLDLSVSAERRKTVNRVC